MKIALICGYTTHEIRNHLQLKSNQGLFKYVIRLLGLPSRVGEFKDTTPWINNIIYGFSKRKDIDLHIVAPHIRLKGKIQEFEMNGVHYHYYATEWSSFVRITNNYRLWKCLQTNGKCVKEIIDNIHPDIVVLSGTENPVSAISVLYTQQFPTIILCQTIYRNPERKIVQGTFNQLIWDLEKDIHKHHKYYGVYCDIHYQVLSKLLPNAYIFDFQYPTMPFPEIKDVPIQYDFINFAYQLTESKGIFDSIKALSLVKKKHPDVTLNLSGGCDNETKKQMDELISELGLEKNVSFTPFHERQEDLFKHIKSARFAILPIKLDNISGTVYQAMFYGLPIVTNNRPGTIKLNEKEECVLLVERDDIEALASKMNHLLEDSKLVAKLKENERRYYEERSQIKDDRTEKLMEDFSAVISNYNNGTEIPKGLLYPHTNK